MNHYRVSFRPSEFNNFRGLMHEYKLNTDVVPSARRRLDLLCRRWETPLGEYEYSFNMLEEDFLILKLKVSLTLVWSNSL